MVIQVLESLQVSDRGERCEEEERFFADYESLDLYIFWDILWLCLKFF